MPEPEGFRKPKEAQMKADFHKGNNAGRVFWNLDNSFKVGWTAAQSRVVYTSKTHRLRRSLWGSKPSPQNYLSF